MNFAQMQEYIEWGNITTEQALMHDLLESQQPEINTEAFDRFLGLDS